MSILHSPSSGQGIYNVRPQDYMLHDSIMEERYEHLMREFAEIDKDGDRELSFEEIYSFLNGKSKDTFTEECCRELFNRLDKDHNQRVTINEFVWTYVELEYKLKKQVSELKKQIADTMRQIEETNVKLINAKATEVRNEHQIMEGSTLTVFVIEAQGLKPFPGGVTNPRIELQCEGQAIETHVIKNNLNPRFNEAFSFAIKTGTEPLKVIVGHVKDSGEFKKMSEGAISLAVLKDQMKKDQLVDVYGPNSELCGRVHLGLAWVWSKEVYYQEILRQWERTLDIDKEELQDIENQLKLLQEPFGAFAITAMTRQPGHSPKLSAMESPSPAQVAAGRIGFFSMQTNWSIALYRLVQVFLLLSIMAMYFKPDFPNVRFMQLCLAITVYYFYMTGEQTKDTFFQIKLGILGCCLYDLGWFLLNIHHWSYGSQYGTWSIFTFQVMLCTIFSLICKGLMFTFLRMVPRE